MIIFDAPSGAMQTQFYYHTVAAPLPLILCLFFATLLVPVSPHTLSEEWYALPSPIPPLDACHIVSSYSLWVSSSIGSDERGDGTEHNPLRTVGRALKYNYNATQLLVINLMDAGNSLVENWELDYVGSLAIQKSKTASFSGRAAIGGESSGVDGPSYFLHGEGAQGDTTSCLYLRDLMLSDYSNTAITALHYRTIYIRNCLFSNSGGSNTADDKGGALFFQSSLIDSTVVLDLVDCAGNTAGYGGCLALDYAGGGTYSIRNSSFQSNTAVHDGGAIYSMVPGNILFSTFVFNIGERGSGGAYYYSGAPDVQVLEFTTMKNCHFFKNLANTRGGAVAIENGAFQSAGLNFEINCASYGGAIYVSGLMMNYPFVSTESHLVENVANISGGGIFLQSIGLSNLEHYSFLNNECGSKSGATQLHVQSGEIEIQHTCSFIGNGSLNVTEIYFADEEVSGEYYLSNELLVIPTMSLEDKAKIELTGSYAATYIMGALVQACGTSLSSNFSISMRVWSWQGGLVDLSLTNGTLSIVESATFSLPTSGVHYWYHNIVATTVEVAENASFVLKEGVQLSSNGVEVNILRMGNFFVEKEVLIQCHSFTVSGTVYSQGNFSLSGGVATEEGQHTTRFQQDSYLSLSLSVPSTPPIVINGGACFLGGLGVTLGWDHFTTANEEIVLVTFLSLEDSNSCAAPKCELFDSDGQLIDGAEFYFTETELVVVLHLDKGRSVWLMVGIGACIVVVLGVVITGVSVYEKKKKEEGYGEEYLINPVERVSVAENSCYQYIL